MKKILIIAILVFLALIPFNVKAEDNAAKDTSGIFKFNKVLSVNAKDKVSSFVIDFLGDIKIDGTVDGSVLSVGSNVYVNGNITGDVTSIGGKILMEPDGHISGQVTQISNLGDLNITVIRIIFILACSGSGAFICLMKSGYQRGTDFKPGRKLIIGLAALIFMPILCFIMMLTVIGIIIIPLLIVILILLFCIGLFQFSCYIGEKALLKLPRKYGILSCYATGIIIIELLLCVPYINISVFLLLLLPVSIGNTIHMHMIEV